MWDSYLSLLRGTDIVVSPIFFFLTLSLGQISAWYALVACVLRCEIEFTEHLRGRTPLCWMTLSKGLTKNNRIGVEGFEYKVSFVRFEQLKLHNNLHSF